jgi:cell division protein FtsW
MRIKRIFGWLYLEEHKSGVGYQAWQAMLALGTGGWFGVGLGNGRQKLGFVPERHTDFILSIIGEELGAVCTLLVVAAYIAMFIAGIIIALRASDAFGTLLGTGITFLIGCQAFINIGVVTSALPNKGLPLPFVSYGGSNLVIMLTCVGVLLSIVLHTSPEEALSRIEADKDSDRDFVMDNPFSAKPQPART